MRNAIKWVMPLLAVSLPMNAMGQKEPPPAPRQGNLVVNGGFEEWVDVKLVPDGILKREPVKHAVRIPADRWPRQWIPFWVVNQSGPAGSADIARDETVAHSGKQSLRLTSRSSKDNICVEYTTELAIGSSQMPPAIRPNCHYILSWWVKGSSVAPGGGCRLDALYHLSQKGGKLQRVDVDVRDQDPPASGTFDWERHEFSFTTDADARSLSFNLGLRSTTGTIWLDDVELKECGPAATVQTY